MEAVIANSYGVWISVIGGGVSLKENIISLLLEISEKLTNMQDNIDGLYDALDNLEVKVNVNIRSDSVGSKDGLEINTGVRN